jgi:hypothetical protein
MRFSVPYRGAAHLELQDLVIWGKVINEYGISRLIIADSVYIAPDNQKAAACY